MTDRINALVVILEEPTRDDDVESLINAIRLLRNVHSVHTNTLCTSDFIAEQKVKSEMQQKLLDIVKSLSQ